MNYAELYQIIADFAVDAEPVFLDNIPNFVRAAEKRIYQDADLTASQKADTPAVTINVATVTMPADFLSVDSFAVTVAGELIFLLPKSIDFLQTAYPIAANTGTPRYYGVKDSLTLQLAPVPSATLVSQLRYFGYPDSIVDASTTWLGDNFEFALQYGALRDAAAFLKEEADIVAMYEAKYQEALAQVKLFGQTGRTDDYRSKGR